MTSVVKGGTAFVSVLLALVKEYKSGLGQGPEDFHNQILLSHPE